jgi:ribulose-phosphate 3-epimerase
VTENQIIPDILTNDRKLLQERVVIARTLTNRVHIDVIDGLFADNKTVMPDDLIDIDWQGLKVDVQLMVDEPDQYLEVLARLQEVRVIGHIERMRNRYEFIKKAKKFGVEVGLGLNLESAVDVLTDEELDQVEVVLLMAVPVGFSGQQFDNQVLAKIVELRRRGYEGDIVMDGGMNMESIPKALAVGANQFAVNSALWQTEEVVKTYQQLVGLVTAYEYNTA